MDNKMNPQLQALLNYIKTMGRQNWAAIYEDLLIDLVRWKHFRYLDLSEVDMTQEYVKVKENVKNLRRNGIFLSIQGVWARLSETEKREFQYYLKRSYELDNV